MNTVYISIIYMYVYVCVYYSIVQVHRETTSGKNPPPPTVDRLQQRKYVIIVYVLYSIQVPTDDDYNIIIIAVQTPFRRAVVARVKRTQINISCRSSDRECPQPKPEDVDGRRRFKIIIIIITYASITYPLPARYIKRAGLVSLQYALPPPPPLMRFGYGDNPTRAVYNVVSRAAFTPTAVEMAVYR